jgi:predicted membrane-bound mannosyltransferase
LDARKGGLKPALLGALGGALFASAVLYSSFFTNFSGMGDALATYKLALTRFGTAAPPTGHEKPWWYYLHLFGWFRDGFLWQQLAFSTLAVVGLVVAFCRSAVAPGQARGPELAEWARDSDNPSRASALPQGAAIYTIVVVAAFSLFAYKTPWQAIHFVPGMAILAAGALAGIGGLRTGKFVAVPLALLVCLSQWQQVKLSSYLRPADSRNPYAYVHSSPDVLKFRPLAEAALARAAGQPIRVISEEYWPLPWYFRGLPRVGYWSEPPEDCDGALVIASVAQTEAVRAKLRGKYRESFLGLRPGFVCIVFTPES